MATVQRRDEREREDSVPVRTAVETAVHAARGGWISTAFSAVAVLASCVSVYVSTLQAAQLEVYVPPAFQYAMDGEGESFTIPITIANGGARGGTVVSIELDVKNVKTGTVQRFYSAYLGEYPLGQTNPQVRQFRPMVILGNTVASDTVRFYPVKRPAWGDEKARIVSEAGDYAFSIKLNTAAPPEPSLLDRIQGRVQPAPLSVTMNLPGVDYRSVMQMRNKDWMATASAAR
jgi:hypothetical protein